MAGCLCKPNIYGSNGGEKETSVRITMVEPNRKQPRKSFDEDSLQELSDSIKQVGLIQPAQLLIKDFLSQNILFLWIFHCKKRSGMSGTDHIVDHHLLYLFSKLC